MITKLIFQILKALTNTCFNMHILFSNQSYSISSPTVLYCYNHMYRRLTNSILFCRLTHRCIIVYDISCNFHCPFLDITFHKNSPHSLLFYNLCGEIFMYVYIEGFLIKHGHLCQCVCYLSQLICSFFDSNTQTAIYIIIPLTFPIL